MPHSTAAVLVATAAADDGGPAAGLPWEDRTVLRRLLDQLASLDVAMAHVITRPEWEPALRRAVEGSPVDARVVVSPGLADDLRAIASVARDTGGRLVVAHADVLTQREALAGLLADPRLRTAVLATGAGHGRPFAWRLRTARGRVMSAASPYHTVRSPNAAFLGVLKLMPDDVPALADVADRLAAIAGDPPESWSQQLVVRTSSWRAALARRSRRPDAADAAPPGPDAVLDPEDEAELARRAAAAPADAVALLLVGLVRSGAHVGNSWLRKLFWARPFSRRAVERAADEITGFDEDRVLLDSAVKANDGFFTTFFVSPYSKYIARFAARRGWTPNQVTTVSLVIGLASGAAFATGSRAGLVAGAILLQIAFTTDCVDGQLARYTRTFSKLGAWLDSIFDRSKEYIAFAGLAIGAARTGDDVWVLAAAAMTLQTARHMLEFSYGASRQQVIASVPKAPLEQPSDQLGRTGVQSVEATAEETETGTAEEALGEGALQAEAPPEGGRRPRLARRLLGLARRIMRRPGGLWARKILGFPIGERFAIISVTAALFDARTTFTVLLVWGGIASAYTGLGRILRSVA